MFQFQSLNNQSYGAGHVLLIRYNSNVTALLQNLSDNIQIYSQNYYNLLDDS